MENADDVIARVGRRICELREAAGLTQAEAAEKLGMTVSNYQRIEHGIQNLSIRTMVSVAGVLNVVVAALFESSSARHRRPGRPKKGKP